MATHSEGREEPRVGEDSQSKEIQREVSADKCYFHRHHGRLGEGGGGCLNSLYWVNKININLSTEPERSYPSFHLQQIFIKAYTSMAFTTVQPSPLAQNIIQSVEAHFFVPLI